MNQQQPGGGGKQGREKRFTGAAQEMLDGPMRKDHVIGADHPSGLSSPKAGQTDKTPNRNRRLVENAEMSNRM